MDFGKGIVTSLVGALCGVVALVSSVPLLIWNENRSVQTHRSLVEGEKILILASATERDRGNEGKLVYVSGPAKPAAPVVDTQTNFRPPALVVKRITEMYQWEETEHTSGSGSNKTTTYEYQERWRDRIENSQRFRSPLGHENPKSFKVPPTTITATSASLGAWQVPANILREIDPVETWTPSAQEMKSIPKPLSQQAHLAGEYVYFAKDPATHVIGDERIRYRIVPIGPISVIAQQKGNAFGEYHTSNGRSLVLAEAGVVDSKTMFAHAFTQNRVLTWILRGAGVFLMFVGLRLLIEPLTMLTDWIPVLGEVVDAGATLACGVLALGGSAVTIAVAWFAVRPLMSGGLLVGAVGLVMLVRKKRRR